LWQPRLRYNENHGCSSLPDLHATTDNERSFTCILPRRLNMKLCSECMNTEACLWNL
jgi:hypothetical protein